jgi:prepilin-type processing-associated H-X9-DG protein
MVSMACLAAAAADAAPPWSAPADVGPGHDAVAAPALAIAPDGNGLAGWNVHTNVPVGPRPAGWVQDAGRVLRLTQGEGFGEVRALPDQVVAGPALDAAGRGVVVRGRLLADGGRTRLTWSAVNAAGAVGTPRPLGIAKAYTSPGLAVDARGDALVAWAEYAPRDRARPLTVKAAWRPAGAARFQAPRTLFRTGDVQSDYLGSVQVAVNASGRGIVVFADGHATRAGLKRHVYAWPARVGRAFGARLTAGGHDGVVDAAAVLAPDGRATVAWGSQDGGEEANRPWVVRVASLGAGARRFDGVKVLDTGAASRTMGRVALAVDGAGRVTLAWTGVRRDATVPQGFAFPVLATTSDGRGGWGAVQALAPMGAVGGVATRADGTAVVTWARVVQYQVTDQATAAVRAAGATAFGPGEPIADPDHAGPPAVAFDPATGAPVALWSARPNGQDPSLGAQPTAVLRIASRAAP